MKVRIIRALNPLYTFLEGNEATAINECLIFESKMMGNKSYPLDCFLIEKIEEEKPKKIRLFKSGAVRSDNTGRERPDFISPYALKAIGEHFAGNENDFGAVNYFKGIPEDAVYESLNRHLLDLQIALLTGDKETARKEWQAVASNAIMGLHTHEIMRLGQYKEVHDKITLIDA